MSEHYVTFQLSNSGTRNDIRMRVVEQFSKEDAGAGDGEAASRYTYYVESLSDGSRVFLRRPAFLHNGFDFVVKVEGANFAAKDKRHKDAPSHDDIASDLVAKKAADSVAYAELYKLLNDLYECKDVSDARIAAVNFDVGLAVDLVVKTVKWLFIEQDIRYWNYSGREMLWSGFPCPE